MPRLANYAPLKSLAALVVLMIALSVTTENFATVDNGLNVLRQISVNLCLSIGMTLVILSGGIDLSVGSVLALAGAVAASCLKKGFVFLALGFEIHFNAVGAVTMGLFVGALLGGVNGQLITRLKLPPFVATLAMLSIARGLTMLHTGGYPLTGLGESFARIGAGSILGIPNPAWITAGLVVVFHILTQHTRWGRHLYAVGGNERAALLSGVNVGRTKRIAYILCGALAGLAGVLVAARLDSATPNAGVGYELDSIAAVVIGGATLSGGRGTVLGAVLGCLLIGVLNNGLVLLQVSPFWQQVIKGLVILIAVAIDQASKRQE